MKRLLLFSFFIAFIFYSCTPDVTTVQVVRHPSINFNFNGASSWQSSKYSFADITKVVVYPQDTTQPGQLYNRLTLQASGKDDAGNDLQLIIAFDVVDATTLVGTYTPVYTADRGLAQVQLFDLTNSSNLASYNLCEENLATASFQIQKQKPDEHLISGNFQMTLCDTRDSTKKINITNGTITDIKY